MSTFKWNGNLVYKVDGSDYVQPVSGTVGAVPSLDTFSRLRLGLLNDDEEARFDSPSTYFSSFAYAGMAIAGSSTASPVWSIMRISYGSLGKKIREQFLTNVAWDDRTLGW